MAWPTPTKVTGLAVSASQTPSVTIPSGALVVVQIFHQGGTPVTVTDSASNAYTTPSSGIDSQESGATAQKRVTTFYKINAAAATSLTITQGASSGFGWHIRIYSGGDATGCTLRGNSQTISTSNGSNIGSPVTGVVAGDIVFGALAYNETTSGTRFDTPNVSGIFGDDTCTQGGSGQTGTLCSLYGVATSTGTQGAQWNMSAGSTGFSSIAFAPGSTGVTITPPVIQGTTTVPAVSVNKIIQPPVIQGAIFMPTYVALTITSLISPDVIQGAISIPVPTPMISQSAQVTAAVIQGTTNVPAPTPQVSRVATPVVIAPTFVNIPAPAVSTGSTATVTPPVIQGAIGMGPVTPLASSKITPAVIAPPVVAFGTDVFLMGGTAFPSVIQGFTSIPIPGAAANTLITPPVIQGAISIPTPIVGAAQTIFPACVTCPAPTMGAVTLQAGSILTPGVIQGAVHMQAPGLAISNSVFISSGGLILPTLMNPATVLSTVKIFPPVISGSILMTTPTNASGTIVFPPVVFGPINMNAPTFTTDEKVSPPVIQGTTQINNVSPTSASGATPAVISGTVSIPSAAIGSGATVFPSAIATGTSIPSVSPFAGGGVTVTPGVIPGFTSIPAPLLNVHEQLIMTVIQGLISMPTPTKLTGTTVYPAAILGTVKIDDTNDIVQASIQFGASGIQGTVTMNAPFVSVASAIVVSIIQGHVRFDSVQWTGTTPVIRPTFSIGVPEVKWVIGDPEYARSL